eukprot:TRINITY_DN11409_c0_g1_i8.p1 TRINITY_DN11409_c0_g1~~TRINITY_DN11409_c0_g1_i8.p1  ORF type:complete len:305 (-),score=34.34 TRINITY_DN11409_c0_g1_i8:176-1090(-)
MSTCLMMRQRGKLATDVARSAGRPENVMCPKRKGVRYIRFLRMWPHATPLHRPRQEDGTASPHHQGSRREGGMGSFLVALIVVPTVPHGPYEGQIRRTFQRGPQGGQAQEWAAILQISIPRVSRNRYVTGQLMAQLVRDTLGIWHHWRHAEAYDFTEPCSQRMLKLLRDEHYIFFLELMAAVLEEFSLPEMAFAAKKNNFGDVSRHLAAVLYRWEQVAKTGKGITLRQSNAHSTMSTMKPIDARTQEDTPDLEDPSASSFMPAEGTRVGEFVMCDEYIEVVNGAPDNDHEEEKATRQTTASSMS